MTAVERRQGDRVHSDDRTINNRLIGSGTPFHHRHHLGKRSYFMRLWPNQTGGR
ncbi:hypothetical protein [Paenibacillus sp. FSL H8-0034]|uniref:hypothetical protein n=1 Tax=Paenibacillus sp. FSL H8-0034 TaxID=2954671 RepID=UPI0030F974FF